MKLVILDRDGVINVDSDKFIKSPAEWRPIPGSLEAIARLNHMGYRVVIASNQSGIGRGLFDMGALNAINDKMYRALSHVGGRVDALIADADAAEMQSVSAGGPISITADNIGTIDANLIALAGSVAAGSGTVNLSLAVARASFCVR